MNEELREGLAMLFARDLNKPTLWHAYLSMADRAIAYLRDHAWEPISTAPKDGEFIVWHGRATLVKKLGFGTKHEYVVSGDDQIMWDGERGAYEIDNPTHWMPSPDGPTSAHSQTNRSD